MSEALYISNPRIERKVGPLRIAHLPGEPREVVFSVHGAIARHYNVDPDKLTSYILAAASEGAIAG